jgi:hypothetical protein
VGQEGDDRLSLPVPPPPRPAARTAAIDAALRRFDGLEDKPSPPKSRPIPWWSTLHRRPAGGLVAAALVAVIAIPVIQLSSRDPQPDSAVETAQPGLAEEAPGIASPAPTANEPPAPAQTDRAAASTGAAPAEPLAAEERANRIAADNKAVIAMSRPPMAAPAPMLAAPPPPPPPPPPSAVEQQADASDVGNIVVTGSRIPAPNAKSIGFAQRAEAPPTEREIAAPYGEFLSRLKEALGANDRRAVLRLVGLPLRVNYAGGARTYRSRQEVERDYDRIFTPAIRESAQNLYADELTARDDARLRGGTRIWFGCGLRTCSSEATIRIREINP